MRIGESTPSGNALEHTTELVNKIKAEQRSHEHAITEANKNLPSEVICEKTVTREPNHERTSGGKRHLSRILNDPSIAGKNGRELLEYQLSSACPKSEREPISRFTAGIAIEDADCQEWSYKIGQDTFSFSDIVYSNNDKDDIYGDLFGEPEARPEGYRGIIKVLARAAARRYNKTQSADDKRKYLTELEALAKIFRGDTIGSLRLKMKEIDNVDERTREAVYGRQSSKLALIDKALNEINTQMNDLKDSYKFYKDCCDKGAKE